MRTDDQHGVKVLSVSTATRDHTCLQHILDHSSWQHFQSRSIAGAVDAVVRRKIAVVITDEFLPDGDWRNLLNQLQLVPEPPKVIVMSATGGDRLLLEVVRSGAYDVIAKPLAKAEVFRIVSLAWRQWHDLWVGKMPVRAARDACA